MIEQCWALKYCQSVLAVSPVLPDEKILLSISAAAVMILCTTGTAVMQ